MTLYLDSSALVKLYVAEEHSAEVAALAQRGDVTFAWNGLHDLEVRNAIRLLGSRGTIAPEAHARALAALGADLATDLYEAGRPDFGKLMKAAERLSGAATALTGARALELMHVAAAQLGAYAAFATFERRQSGAARVAGLAIFEIV
jgi:predicted nucleic acid-binding protein